MVIDIVGSQVISAIVGGIAGGSISIITAIYQQKKQDKRLEKQQEKADKRLEKQLEIQNRRLKSEVFLEKKADALIEMNSKLSKLYNRTHYVTDDLHEDDDVDEEKLESYIDLYDSCQHALDDCSIFFSRDVDDDLQEGLNVYAYRVKEYFLKVCEGEREHDIDEMEHLISDFASWYYDTRKVVRDEAKGTISDLDLE